MSHYSLREDGKDASQVRWVSAHGFSRRGFRLTGPPTAKAGMEISTTLLASSAYILPEGRSEAASVAPERIWSRTGAMGISHQFFSMSLASLNLPVGAWKGEPGRESISSHPGH